MSVNYEGGGSNDNGEVTRSSAKQTETEINTSVLVLFRFVVGESER